MKTQNKWKFAINLLSLILMLAFSLEADSLAKGNKSRRAVDAGTANKIELNCSVRGNENKVVTMTNNIDRVITKGTAVNFDDSTGISKKISLRSDLEPGETVILHAGRFVGFSCQCFINQ